MGGNDWTLKISRYADIVRERHGCSPAEMVPAFYQGRGRALFLAREKARQAVRGRAAWEAERARLDKALREAVGWFPARRTVVREVGLVRKENLEVRKLLYAPFPGHWVPANLYLPRGFKGRRPALVMPPGHGLAGKGGYGERAAFFARNGYVVITIDFIGEGERHLAWDGRGPAAFPSTQHNILGGRMLLHGCNLMGLLIVETMGALDVLAGHGAVDPARIGLTGASGGGTLTFFTAAADRRVAAAAPAASVHSFSTGLHADDSEQVFFGGPGAGVHYPDVAAFLIAPRPLLIIANERDIWPLASTEYVRDAAAPFYRLLGAPEKLELQTWSKGHSYDHEQWPAALAWFNRWLGGPARPVFTGPVPPGDILAREESLVSVSGNIYAEGYRDPGRVFVSRAGRRPARGGSAACLAFLEKALAGGRAPRVEEIDRYRVGTLAGRRIIFETEPGISLPAEILAPRRPRGLTLLLDELDRREAPEWLAAAAARGRLAVRPDLRGWGETAPPESWEDWENWCQNLYSGRRYKLFALARLAGRNLVLERARDALAALAAARRWCPEGPVTFHGRRGGALVAAFAALGGGEKVDRLVLESFPASYRAVLAADRPAAPADGFIEGFLDFGCDLMDLLADCYRGRLEVRDPLDAWLRPRRGRRRERA